METTPSGAASGGTREAEPSGFIAEVLRLTNQFRQQNGVQALSYNNKLGNAAQGHSLNMANQDFFSHTGKDGSTIGQRVTAAGYQWSTTGENIAAGYTTPAAVVEGWINSPGHRANLLNPNYQEIGIGYYHLANDTGQVNYYHYWTQNFGRSL
ncbi:MAG: CAP domain-containing protein [Cyanobacteria bacterium J069]|nr:MAG: CAP domain-containing protein [Cyanobacteria bacterium J069]